MAKYDQPKEEQRQSEAQQPITTALIEGKQYTVKNPEDLGQEGKPIFATDETGKIQAFPNHKVTDPVTQTQGELDQRAADQQTLIQGIADPNAQVIHDETDPQTGVRHVQFNNGQSKVITAEGEHHIANNPDEEDALLEKAINGEPIVKTEPSIGTEPTEHKIVTQTIGNTPIDIIEHEDHDEVVPTDKVPLEKALPILEKKFKDNKKFKVVSEKVQVEEPGETKYDDPIKKTVIKSIKIVPVTQNENLETQNSEKVSENSEAPSDNQDVANVENTNSLQKNQLENEKSMESSPIHSESGQVASQGEDTPQTQQGKGNEKGLEENVNIQAENPVVGESFTPGDSAPLDNEIAQQEVNLNPTEAQKEAGNYKMAHVKIQGMDITIENPKGSIRKGVDEDGKAWEQELQSHYGYFKRTNGKDGDHIDTFIGGNPESQTIFVVDQNHIKTRDFDESKVMTGFNTIEEAKAAYLANYEPGWQGLRSITAVPVDQFKEWLNDGAQQRKPFAEYKGHEELSKVVPESENNQSPVIPEVKETPETVTEKIQRQSAKATLKEIQDKGFVRVANPTAVAEKIKKYTGIPVIASEEFGTVKLSDNSAPVNKFPIGSHVNFTFIGTEKEGEVIEPTRPLDKGVIQVKDATGFVYTILEERASLIPVVVDGLTEDKQLEKEEPLSEIDNSEEESGGKPDENNEMSAEEEAEGVEQAQKLTDFGEKIGMARKDVSEKGFTRIGKGKEESQPAWSKKYRVFDQKEMAVVERIGWKRPALDPEKFTIAIAKGNSFRTIRENVASEQEAYDMIPLIEVSINHRVYPSEKNKDQFSIYRKWSSGKLFEIKKGFESKDEAMKYMALHPQEIINYKTARIERPHLDSIERTGPERRKGNVTPEQFMNAFGLRAGEFGNWVAGDERQEMLNFAYDAFADMAEVLGVPYKAISLNGRLAIGFGSRGQGLSGASAHFEPRRGVINLTKINGAGALAHEWFHAFDSYLGIKDRKGYEPNEDGVITAIKDESIYNSQ
ncbi:MAG: LPD5 domain-containing protein, partial [Bacteroidales bacterium]|nr:LPD5 domain-containing protein [Bacteroidales bacterium]